MRQICHLLSIILCLFVATSCGSDAHSNTNDNGGGKSNRSQEMHEHLESDSPTTIETPSETIVTSIPDSTTGDSIPIAQKVERPTRRPPEMTFVTTTHTYDTIEQGDIVEYEFKFTNTGERPLTIKDVKGSCGCTIGSYPFLDIAPGEQNVIKARFDSKGKQGPQFTTITVYSNANPKGDLLSLKGIVRGPDGSVAPSTLAH